MHSSIAFVSFSFTSSSSLPVVRMTPGMIAVNAVHEGEQLLLELADLICRNIEQCARNNGIDDDNLLFDRNRAVLRLLEHLYDARALFQTLLGVRVQVGAELRERLQLTELRVRQLERTGNLLHRLDLRVAADTGYRNTRVYRRTDTGVEQLGLEEDLTVGNGDYVGRDIRRNVACLRLDDRECGQAAAVLDVRCTLEQTEVR